MPRVHPDFPTNPSPPGFGSEKGFFVLLIIWFFCQTNNQHFHISEDNSAGNDQQFCDNPDHFTFDNEAPPAYDAIKSNSKESTPLLNTTKLKRCIKPSCANYLKPFRINKEYSRERFQSVASTSPSCSNTDFLINFPNEDNLHHPHPHNHKHHGNKSDHGHHNEGNGHRSNKNHWIYAHYYHNQHHMSHDNSSHSFNHQNNHASESAQISHNSNNDHHVSYENHGASTDHHTSFDHHDSGFDSHHD
ncbi:hypothetical protein CONCODRAFT_77591 [Conidiobolus coronatus NRRL 28638]|uniref:Uncharacterized protein n=1 Tax=Conidiobolus coronatus (strain ATCC 28846 / CBS 209.66 / NRRL 28638) TaxID=796925 RepID=A0A137PCZ9_CONC2|nr:hypothetical protein CONCODRAFT_77591 [Conidiobolus coronatus NRRL 28638]|eukprot:KXN72860.1 hypothetical protein CONCODRAFT_77591 [Conidiobolus coronatus NRRL 28638]